MDTTGAFFIHRRIARRCCSRRILKTPPCQVELQTRNITSARCHSTAPNTFPTFSKMSELSLWTQSITDMNTNTDYYGLVTCNWNAPGKAFLERSDPVVEELLFFVFQSAICRADNVLVVRKFVSFHAFFQFRNKMLSYRRETALQGAL